MDEHFGEVDIGIGDEGYIPGNHQERDCDNTSHIRPSGSSGRTNTYGILPDRAAHKSPSSNARVVDHYCKSCQRRL